MNPRGCAAHVISRRVISPHVEGRAGSTGRTFPAQRNQPAYKLANPAERSGRALGHNAISARTEKPSRQRSRPAPCMASVPCSGGSPLTGCGRSPFKPNSGATLNRPAPASLNRSVHRHSTESGTPHRPCLVGLPAARPPAAHPHPMGIGIVSCRPPRQPVYIFLCPRAREDTRCRVQVVQRMEQSACCKPRGIRQLPRQPGASPLSLCRPCAGATSRQVSIRNAR